MNERKDHKIHHHTDELPLGNLLGTIRTLDDVDGATQLYHFSLHFILLYGVIDNNSDFALLWTEKINMKVIAPLVFYHEMDGQYLNYHTERESGFHKK